MDKDWGGDAREEMGESEERPGSWRTGLGEGGGSEPNGHRCLRQAGLGREGPGDHPWVMGSATGSSRMQAGHSPRDWAPARLHCLPPSPGPGQTPPPWRRRHCGPLGPCPAALRLTPGNPALRHHSATAAALAVDTEALPPASRRLCRPLVAGRSGGAGRGCVCEERWRLGNCRSRGPGRPIRLYPLRWDPQTFQHWFPGAAPDNGGPEGAPLGSGETLNLDGAVRSTCRCEYKYNSHPSSSCVLPGWLDGERQVVFLSVRA